ncbi:aminodeoxychorismate/anthranilate synthase component II [Cytobacillus sp. Sa5YUA1]|uniref:Aminodeoxychorismate/anthranilate synthase component II n=1 Tax=Cytobacillus stercorigallinarum TaxID=2762240 RepID=A0ABR8QVS7_9BACI|nr:aminodeoxychorismate/anthranilate synthase component II [Cytobacillus stercorigallinarum]MBD7939625.1 aminodeoxychorismate/anthranilate synthase component II [Cytobacillus stercorigallinarum]
MILLIDNYDSFTYNLYQYIGELGQTVVVKRNNQITVDEIRALHPTHIILSPGPGRPENAGICVELIQQLYQEYPILGVCLGHQAIGYAFGAEITEAKKIMHGKTSNMMHTGGDVFQYMSQPLVVMRYHSLVIKSGSLPGYFNILARSLEDGEIMAIKHETFDLYGFQFHLESIGTLQGQKMLRHFIENTKRREKNERNTTAINQ